jgi:hypothetical protein
MDDHGREPTHFGHWRGGALCVQPAPISRRDRAVRAPRHPQKDICRWYTTLVIPLVFCASGWPLLHTSPKRPEKSSRRAAGRRVARSPRHRSDRSDGATLVDSSARRASIPEQVRQTRRPTHRPASDIGSPSIPSFQTLGFSYEEKIAQKGGSCPQDKVQVRLRPVKVRGEISRPWTEAHGRGVSE